MTTTELITDLKTSRAVNGSPEDENTDRCVAIMRASAKLGNYFEAFGGRPPSE